MNKSHETPFKHVYYRPKPNIRLYNQSTAEYQISDNRIKFTVIGNIVTKEFIHCMRLVTKLYQYRPKQFLAPVIRGVTSVEWPTVWKDLKIQYDVSEYCIKSEVAVLMNDVFLGGENDLKEFIESRYVCPLRLDYYKEGIQQLANYINSFGRPCVYLHISIDSDPIGTMIFMLYSDIVPKTCENFLKLCNATKDGYSGTPIHRIVKDSWIQCGGFNLKSNKKLGCENFDIPHDRRGVLCMANNGRHIDCSTQFFVLLQPAPWMKHKYVAFGQLIEGEKTLRNIENVTTSHESPNAEIIIYKTGTFDINLHPKPVSKYAKEYINGHIEDLVTAGEVFYEAILENTFKEINKERTKPEISDHQDISNVRPAKSFLISGNDINRQESQTDMVESLNASGSVEANEIGINECEYEEYTNYDRVTPVDTRTDTSCSAIKPKKVFYIPLTDTEFPGEVNSTFEIHKLLRGDYCLESDLQKEKNEQLKHIPEEVISAMLEGSENSDKISESISNSTEEEIKAYIKKHMDTVSFGGPLIKKMADGNKKFEIFEHLKGEKKKMGVITDEELRLIRKKIVHTSSSHYGIGKTDSVSDLLGPITDFINCGEDIDFSVYDMTSNIFSRDLTPSEDSTGSRISDPELYQVPSKISSSILNTQRGIVNDPLSATKTLKKRPSMTVTEYQKKNQLHEVDFKNSKSMKADNAETAVAQIQGTASVSSVEWPKIWNELKMEFGPEVYCLKSQVAVLINNKFLGGEDKLRQLIETTYVYLKPEYLNFFKEGAENFSNFVKSQGRPCAILHIAIDDVPIGPLIFMLYSDIVPLTCQNFITLCELSKGGYRGTPIHRIVENGWIQCGGFGMKNTKKLNCENYIVPHDRRGVLCMANDGRHNDCSTQFFVLLQPALWMKHKYVAFGQLIEGEQTLKKIENVPTWYESPTARISIYGAGIFNMECQWEPINKSATEYISSHIEDLVELGTLLFEELLEKAYPIIEAREIERGYNMVKLYEECPEESDEDYIDQTDKKMTSEKETTKREGKKSNQAPTPTSTDTNNQYDVEEYVLEEMSVVADLFPPPVPSDRVLQKPYYLPLTDIPCPGEVESAFNLQRLVRGDFCFESDLVMSRRERARMYAENNQNNQYLYISKEKFNTLFDCLEPRTSENSLDFDDEREIEAYIRENADSISLAGPVINKIANMQDKYDMFDEMNEGGNKGILCDEDLRLMRVVAKELHTVQSTTVTIKDSLKSPHKIHRRQTGFVRQEQLNEFEMMLDHLPETANDDDAHDSVCTTKWEDRLSAYNKNAKTAKSNREQTTHKILYRRRSTLTRNPTFKDFKPTSEGEDKTNYDYLTRSALHFTMRDDNVKLRTPPPNIGYDTIQNTLTLQHGSKLTRKVSSDYPTTLNRFSELEHQSLRTIEYSKIRPSMSVGEYKSKNQKYMDEQLAISKSKMGTQKK